MRYESWAAGNRSPAAPTARRNVRTSSSASGLPSQVLAFLVKIWTVAQPRAVAAETAQALVMARRAATA